MKDKGIVGMFETGPRNEKQTKTAIELPHLNASYVRAAKTKVYNFLTVK